MDGNAKRLTVNGMHIHENSTESASDGVACGNIQCDPAAVTGSQMTAEYTSATAIQAKTTTDVANTTLCLLKELRKYLELEDNYLQAQDICAALSIEAGGVRKESAARAIQS